MKNIVLMLCAAATLAMFSVPAHALSEQTAPLNSDGSAKFADPDERAPAFLVTPSGGSGPASSSLSGGNVQAPSIANYMGTMGPGAQSFDHATAHLQNQNQ